jgi:hypothetical protein
MAGFPVPSINFPPCTTSVFSAIFSSAFTGVKYLTSCVATAQHVLPTTDGFMQFPEDFYRQGEEKSYPDPESLRQFFIETSIIGEIILSFGTEQRLLPRIVSGMRIAPMSSTVTQ